MKTRNASLAVAAMLSLSGAAFAGATYTTIQPAPSGELGHAAILQNMYGGTWSMSTTTPVNATNGVMTATRVADAGVSSPLALATSSAATADDSAFAGQTVSVTVKARYAGDQHILGWIDDTASTPVFQQITSSSNLNNPVTLTLSSNFRWAMHDTTTGRMFTSRRTDNLGIGAMSNQTFDHLVTYHITPKSGPANQWALFWEDRTGGEGSDFDYNDAAFTVQAIPTPGVATLSGIGLLLLGSRRRR